MRSLLTLLIIISVFVVPGYLIFQKNQISPPEATVKVAKSIRKYPGATSWEVKEGKRFCLQVFFDCGRSVDTIFSTSATWPDIYNFYKLELIYEGWNTNSTIFTSVPSSITFTGKDNCEVIVSEVQNQFNSKEKSGQFKIQVTCTSK